MRSGRRGERRGVEPSGEGGGEGESIEGEGAEGDGDDSIDEGVWGDGGWEGRFRYRDADIVLREASEGVGIRAGLDEDAGGPANLRAVEVYAMLFRDSVENGVAMVAFGHVDDWAVGEGERPWAFRVGEHVEL